jgi:hypothetical protein
VDCSPVIEYRTPFDDDVEFAKVLAAAPRIEHLTNLAAVPPTGARFTAVPPKVREFGTFSVRTLPGCPEGLPVDA